MDSGGVFVGPNQFSGSFPPSASMEVKFVRCTFHGGEDAAVLLDIAIYPSHHPKEQIAGRPGIVVGGS